MSHGGSLGATHELIHWIAALVLVGGGAVFLLAAAWLRYMVGRRRRDSLVDVPAPGSGRSIIQVIAGLSLGAGAIHLAAAPHHYTELGDLGAGFLVAGVFQVGWARAVLTSTSARTAWIGIGGNVAIVAAWIVSRSVGLPVGPDPWIPEAIGLPDGAATVFALLIVAGLTLRLLGIDRALGARWAPARSIAAIAVVPALGLVLLTSSLATVAIVAGADHGRLPVSPAGSAEHPLLGH